MKLNIVHKQKFEIQSASYDNSKQPLVSRKLCIKLDGMSQGKLKGILLPEEFEKLNFFANLHGQTNDASNLKILPNSSAAWKDLATSLNTDLHLEVGFSARNEPLREFVKFEDCEAEKWLKTLERKIADAGFGLKLKFKIENFKYNDSVPQGDLEFVTEVVALTEVDSQSAGARLYGSGFWDRRHTWNRRIGNTTGALTILCIVGPTENCLSKYDLPLLKDLQNSYRVILANEVHTDAVIVSKEEKVMKCHKAIITAQSSVLETMFNGSFKESKTNKIEMPDMSEAAVKAFLAYFYHREVPVSDSDVALELYKAAHKYNIPTLQELIKTQFHSKPNDWFDVETVVCLFLFTRNLDSEEDLKTKAVKLIRLKYFELEDSPSYNELFQKSPEAAKELCQYAFKTSF